MPSPLPQADRLRPRFRLWHLLALVLASALVFGLIRGSSGPMFLVMLPTLAAASVIEGRKLARRTYRAIVDGGEGSGRGVEIAVRLVATLVWLSICLATIMVVGALVAGLAHILMSFPG